MPGTVKSELLPDADRLHKCDGQEKVCEIQHLPLDKSHFITVFGSYQKEGELNVVKNSAIISCAVIFVAVLAGMMIFPMVYSFGLSVTEGPGLVFVVMPNVFNQMAGGVIWGTLFYIAFFIAAFSSGIAGWEAVMGFLMDQFNLTRQNFEE